MYVRGALRLVHVLDLLAAVAYMAYVQDMYKI